MEKIEFWKRMANERATEWIQIRVPPVLKEYLVAEHPNLSKYVLGLIIADYERQLSATTADTH